MTKLIVATESKVKSKTISIPKNLNLVRKSIFLYSRRLLVKRKLFQRLPLETKLQKELSIPTSVSIQLLTVKPKNLQ